VEQSERGAAMIATVYDDQQRALLADALAGGFLSGPWKAELVAESGAGCLDRWPSWMTGLSLRVVAVYRSPPIDRRQELVALIEAFLAETPARAGESVPPAILRLITAGGGARRSAYRPPRLDHGWPIAEIDSVGALAERLELSDGQLAWLADVRSLERTVAAERLRNYRYRAMRRQGGLPRIIEAPKARLKEIQRWILREILDHVAPHEAAHGFSQGRSVLSHARLHTGQSVVLRLDLKDFFASIPAGRVFGIFRTLGYGAPVAHVLTGLSTNTIPAAVWREVSQTVEPRLVQQQFWLGRQLATPHLPQGAPTSPALANLTAFRLDRRLAGLATSAGLRYSRYADDLVFSGPRQSRRRRDRFRELVAEIARDESFSINASKSTLRTAAARQSVCGIVVNVRLNVTRAEYDRLRAILHNAVRHGPESQNQTGIADFQAHLRGRIAWVASLNRTRGDKLRRAFGEIDWPESRSD
jgi:RNA-directed DNA polymerase